MNEQLADTIRLTPSRTRTAMLFVAMLVWIAIGVSRYLMVGGIMWLGLTLVGVLGALVYGLMLLPNSSYLEATPAALTIRTAFRTRSYAWEQIDSFYVETILTKKVVKYRYFNEPAGGVSDTDAGRMNAGKEETLPDTYGLTPEELATLLNTYLVRHTR